MDSGASASEAAEPTVVHRAGRDLADFTTIRAAAFADLRRSARLAPALFEMQLRARRRANLLGWLWLLLPTALTLAIGISLQRHGPFVLPRTQISFAAFVTIGIAVWQSFAEAMAMPLRQLAMHRFSITRARMPLEAPILAGAIEVLAGSLIRVALLLPILPLLGIYPGWSLLALPILLIGLISLALAVGTVAAPIGVLVEDAGRAMVVLVGLWMLASPVAYPVPEALWLLNPAAPLIDGLRACLSGGAVPMSAFVAATVSMALLIPAWTWLRLSRQHLIDRVT